MQKRYTVTSNKFWSSMSFQNFVRLSQNNSNLRYKSGRLLVLWRTINLGRHISDISKKSMQATIYCHYD
jgi:hypothetical protein